jgi:hypothetical protein
MGMETEPAATFDLQKELALCREELRLQRLAAEQMAVRAREHWERLCRLEGKEDALLSRAREAADSKASVLFFLEEVVAEPSGGRISGWGHLPGTQSEACQTYVVVSTGVEARFFQAQRLERPDVAEYFGEPAMRWAGFTVFCPRDLLPARLYWIGLFLEAGENLCVYVPTDRFLCWA